MDAAVEKGIFDLGLHVLTRTAFVSPEAEKFDPDDEELIDELEAACSSLGSMHPGFPRLH